MKISPAETIGADAGPAGRAVGFFPVTQLCIDMERRIGKIEVRIRPFGIECGRQLLVVEGHGGLEQPGCARTGLQMTDVALGRPNSHALPRRAAENRSQGLGFHHIPDLGTGAVSLDQGSRGRIQAGIFPGPLNGQHLAFRIGRGNALALAVARRANAANNGVDLVAVPLGIAQPLEQECAAALAHDETVRALAERTAARGAEGANLAKLDEDRRAHVAVYAAGHHCVHVIFGEHLECGVDGGKAGGARCVGNEVGPPQVQHICHPSRDNIGQFAGHGVFGNIREMAGGSVLPLV